MEYYFKPSALKDLKKLSREVRRRIIDKLDTYAKSAQPLKFAESIKDKSLGEFRFRIGDYRVVFDVTGDKIIFLATGHREDIYRR